ncbi:hypothetical protein WR25_01418 isoform D [Diploscapter pachys]|nr:hypothetical protein WR25_01418 isoform D [Diploscapter pachys]
MFIQISFGCVFSGAGALGVPYFHFPYLVSKNFPKLVEIFAKLQAITLEGVIGTGSTLANIVLIGIGLVLLYLMVVSFFYQLLFNFVAIVRIHLFKSFSFVYVNVFLILATIGISFNAYILIRSADLTGEDLEDLSQSERDFLTSHGVITLNMQKRPLFYLFVLQGLGVAILLTVFSIAITFVTRFIINKNYARLSNNAIAKQQMVLKGIIGYLTFFELSIGVPLLLLTIVVLFADQKQFEGVSRWPISWGISYLFIYPLLSCALYIVLLKPLRIGAIYTSKKLFEDQKRRFSLHLHSDGRRTEALHSSTQPTLFYVARNRTVTNVQRISLY